MKRLFLATNPPSIGTLQAWKDLKPSGEPFILQPVGFDGETRRFETLVPGKDYEVVILSDIAPDPLGAVEVHPEEDYLVYHKNSANAGILSAFAPSRMVSSSHTSDSAYAKVLNTLLNGLPEGVGALISSLMSVSKREIQLFLCDFEKLPALPGSLSALGAEYEQIRDLSRDADDAARVAARELSDRKKAFIRRCLEIYDTL